MVFDALMPHWVEFNQMRTGKELELFDEFSSFKKQKVIIFSISLKVSAFLNNFQFLLKKDFNNTPNRAQTAIDSSFDDRSVTKIKQLSLYKFKIRPILNKFYHLLD